MKIYGQSKRRQDLARLLEGAGGEADQTKLGVGFRPLELPAANVNVKLRTACPFGQYWNSAREQCVKIGE
jgi:hypothetical protein